MITYINMTVKEENTVHMTIQNENPIHMHVEAGGSSLPPYSGDYQITPRKQIQVLDTKNHTMTKMLLFLRFHTQKFLTLPVV